MAKYIVGGMLIILLVGAGYYFSHKNTPAPIETPTTTPDVQIPVTKTYASSTMAINVTYPPEFTLNEKYQYTQFPKKPVNGLSLTIPMSMATGTNLSTDTRLSVEQLPHAMRCSGDIFIPENVKSSSITIGNSTYSVATTSGAGAGNFYEEIVYAFPDSKPCTAVRYYIHSTNINNYPPGMVTEFNRVTLLAAFDTIRQSLVVGASSAPAPASTSTTSTQGAGDSAPVVGVGEHCGGFIRNAPVCAAGFHCQLKVSNPDTGGTCVAGAN